MPFGPNSADGIPTPLTRKVWFPGWTYNATPGSRAAITDAIQNGYVVCYDPEIVDDFASLPANMVVKPPTTSQQTTLTDDARLACVTKPATALLSLGAGVVIGQPAGGKAGAQWLTIVTNGPVSAYTNTNMSGSYGVLLGPVNDSWALGTIALGTNGANLHQVMGKNLKLVDTSSSAAANAPVILGGLAAQL